MKLLRQPISASDRIPDRFCIISMEFLSLSRRRSSSRNVPQRRWARRNVCRSQAKSRRSRGSNGNQALGKPIGQFRVPKTITFKTRLMCKTLLMKMSFICMNKKNIFISIAVHLVSLWHRGLKQLGNSLLHYPLDRNSFRGLCYPPSKLLRYFFRNPQLGRGPRTGHSSHVTPTKYLFILKTTSWKE